MKKCALLALLVLGTPACGLLGNECGRNNPATYYDVQGADVGLSRQPTDRPWEVAAAGATVSSRELRLRASLKERHYTSQPSLGLMSAAYACSPVPAGSLGSTERMDSISITSAYAYDAAHPAGTPLNDVLEAPAWPQWPQQPSRRTPQEPLRFVEFSFKVPPIAAGPQKFRLYYHQTNGEVYTAETTEITVLR